jgi:polygalacturonase
MPPSSRRDFLALAAAPVIAAGQNVRDAGAKADGTTLDTESIQRAIDSTAEAGGGTVLFPPGVYLSGTLEMRSRVSLHLTHGAVLRGSPQLDHYPPRPSAFRSYTDNYTERCLIRGENLSNIGIEGAGTIDGQGASFSGAYKLRPYLLRFIQCKGVTLHGVRLENSPMWVQHYLACDDVLLNGVTVRSRVNGNNDGIDIDSCQRVRISDCDISSGDDAICLKSTSARVCRDIVVSNCVVSSRCNAIKLGTETNGGFENVNISNCALYDTRLAGLALEIVDGGTLDNVVISGITMRGVQGPIFVRLGDRGRPFLEGDPKPPVGKLGGVLIQGVRATGAGRIGCSITGIPQAPVRRIALRDIAIEFEGGGTASDSSLDIPELPDAYPEYSMFKTLPAYALFCRHAEDVSIDGLSTSFRKDDYRPALRFDDVARLRLRDIDAQALAQASAAAILRNAPSPLIRDCRVFGGAAVFEKLEDRP